VDHYCDDVRLLVKHEVPRCGTLVRLLALGTRRLSEDAAGLSRITWFEFAWWTDHKGIRTGTNASVPMDGQTFLLTLGAVELRELLERVEE
jgi:hypothetical protein